MIRESDLFVVLDTLRKGLGVFVRVEARPDEALLRFDGTPHDSYGAEPDSLQIGPDLYIGPTTALAYLVNHSCRPNCFIDMGEDGSVWLVALRPIPEGTELTFDYSATMADDDWTMECFCGMPNCRGRIGEFRHLPLLTKLDYARRAVAPRYAICSDPEMRRLLPC